MIQGNIYFATKESFLSNMDKKGSTEFVDGAGLQTPDDITSESVSYSDRLAGETSSKGSASPSKSLCSSTSTSAENVMMEMKVDFVYTFTS